MKAGLSGQRLSHLARRLVGGLGRVAAETALGRAAGYFVTDPTTVNSSEPKNPPAPARGAARVWPVKVAVTEPVAVANLPVPPFTV